jgi:hypothetical protein
VALCCHFILHRDLLFSETRQVSAYAKARDLAAPCANLSEFQTKGVTCLI